MRAQISTFNLIAWILTSSLACMKINEPSYTNKANTCLSLVNILSNLNQTPAGEIMLTNIACEHENCSIKGQFYNKKIKYFLEKTTNLNCELSTNKFICQNNL